MSELDPYVAEALVNFFGTGPTGWQGDATSVNEFLRPLRAQLDAPCVLEVCVNRPGELLVETVHGWQVVAAPELTQERCVSLATAVATFSDQQINQERPLLSATLPSGERIQFADLGGEAPPGGFGGDPAGDPLGGSRLGSKGDSERALF